MYFLTKLFELRDSSNPDSEKPFLAHLDDLRVTITRIALTLLIATIVCYVFRNQLMAIIRSPVEKVWSQTQNTALSKLDPRPSVATWEEAVQVANNAFGLSPEQRAHFLKHADTGDANFAFHVESALHYRVAMAIQDAKKREAYVTGIPNLAPEQIRQLKELLKGNPSIALDEKGSMVVMQSLNPTEGFMLSIKLAFFAALVISFPLLLLFLLQFILPGLHKKEQQALFPALGVGFFLFLTGVLFAYFIILPNVLDFFYQYSLQMGIQNDWRIGYYISFATQFVLIFGLAFELPVVVMTLVKLDILSYDMMRTTRSYAILAIVVIAAIITPTPDALTLSLLAVPMYLLYEICIWLSYFLDRKAKAKEAAEEKERLARLVASPKAQSRRLSEDKNEDLDESNHEAKESEESATERKKLSQAEDEPNNSDEGFVGPDAAAEELYGQAPAEPQEKPEKDDDNRDEDPYFDLLNRDDP